ncbi:hypothetical protein RB195_022979 [Necator americanus]|uniref:Uncharacterized protein n=1 Tax=Necator americanus TaxID=51031 RepID=A0ABR1EHD8_NECAM
MLTSKIPNHRAVIVGTDTKAKMELEQQPDVIGKRYYLAKQTLDNTSGLVDLCEQTNLIIASKLKKNH